MLRPTIVANWKMNKTIPEAEDYLRDLLGYIEMVDMKRVEVVISPPFTAIKRVLDLISGKEISLGAQNFYQAEDGSYTGEISARQVADLGCRYVILGHSERRRFFSETSDLVSRKLAAALSHGIIPILCIGETLEERKAGKVFEVIGDQIWRSLASLPPFKEDQLVIAYEPVWAIGTGISATAKEVAQVHGFIRQKTEGLCGGSNSVVRILYGGSVTPENIGWIMGEPNVDGVLVGNASLKAESFSEIIKKSIDRIKQEGSFK